MWLPSRHALTAIPVLAVLAASGSAAIGLTTLAGATPEIAMPTYSTSGAAGAPVPGAPTTVAPRPAPEPPVAGAQIAEPAGKPTTAAPGSPQETGAKPAPVVTGIGQVASDPASAQLRRQVIQNIQNACSRGELNGPICLAR